MDYSTERKAKLLAENAFDWLGLDAALYQE